MTACRCQKRGRDTIKDKHEAHTDARENRSNPGVTDTATSPAAEKKQEMDVFQVDDQEKKNQAKLKNMWESEASYLTAKVAFGGPIFNSL